jgi:hypothetical protein
MGTMTKFKLGFLALMCLGVAGISLRAYLFGEGWIHVMFPADDIGTLKVDGREVRTQPPRNRTRTFMVSQGKHRITVERPSGASTAYALEVKDGFAFMVVPVDDQQCFAMIDVTDSRYGDGKGPSTVLARYTTHGPMDIPDCPYFGVESLPKSIKSNSTALVLRDIPCSMAGYDDARLLKELGE